MTPLRLCLLTQQYRYRWSGLGTYATNLIDGLADAGHDVTVVCPEEANRNGIHHRVHLITMPKNRFDPSHGQWFTLSYKFSRILPKLHQRGSFHVVHFTDAREALFCPKINVPVVGTANDCYFAEAPPNPLFFRNNYHDWIRRFVYYQVVKKLEPRAYTKLTGIIATSRYVKETLVRCYGLTANSIDLIYYGLRPFPSQVAAPRRPKDEAYRILFVGSNFQRKGLPTVLRALPQVLARLPAVRLYVIGKDPNEEAMRQLCRRRKIDSHVDFLGWQPHAEVHKQLQLADLFIMPSLIENFAFVYLEAMAAGVPVIGSNVGGTRELITDGVNGFLVKPLDPRGLAHKICLVLENHSLREQLITQGFQTIKRFTVKQMVEETIRYYEKMIREQGSSRHRGDP